MGDLRGFFSGLTRFRRRLAQRFGSLTGLFGGIPQRIRRNPVFLGGLPKLFRRLAQIFGEAALCFFLPAFGFPHFALAFGFLAPFLRLLAQSLAAVALLFRNLPLLFRGVSLPCDDFEPCGCRVAVCCRAVFRGLFLMMCRVHANLPAVIAQNCGWSACGSLRLVIAP